MSEDDASVEGGDEPFHLMTPEEEKVFRPSDPRYDSADADSSLPISSEKDPKGNDDGTMVGTPHEAEKPPEKTDRIYIEFEKNDPRDPYNTGTARKWLMTFMACALTGFTAANGGTFAIAFDSMQADLHCSREMASLALALYPLGFGIAPLFLASFSEEIGRRWMYIVTTFLFCLCFLPIALAKNIATVMVFRFIQGAAGSTGSTMVGGTIADIFQPSQRGFPMTLFAVGAFVGSGLGPAIAGFIEQNQSLQWRWIQWFSLIISGVCTILIALIMQETRSAVILTRLARRLRKKTGDERYRARAEDERPTMKSLIYVSCTRPLYLLATEPVVASFSLWVGFAWGILWALLESVGLVFKTLYNFNPAQSGMIFLSITIGSVFGFACTWYQEKLYQKHFATKSHEARLYAACFGGVCLPIGCFIYAWTSFSNVHWIAPAIGIVVLTTGIFLIYLAVFLYLADVYHLYASSALAGQSLIRNLSGFAFPLFTDQMYTNMTYHWASTTFALISIVLAVVPFVLFFWGPRIRARSKFAVKLEKASGG